MNTLPSLAGLNRPTPREASVDLLMSRIDNLAFKKLLALLQEVDSPRVWSSRFPNWNRDPGAYRNPARQVSKNLYA